MHLPQRRRGRCLAFELGEAALPVRSQLGFHPALDEGPAHGRGVGLQLAQIFGVFLRQCVGDRCQQLCCFHQRSLEVAQCILERRGMAGLVQLGSQHPVGPELDRKTAQRGPDPRIATQAAPEAVFIHTVCHSWDMAHSSRICSPNSDDWAATFSTLRRVAAIPPLNRYRVSSSSMKLSSSPRPCRQKLGSRASRPKGASSSWWRSVPPAPSISRYLPAKSSPLFW